MPKTKKEEIARLSAALLAAIDAPVPVKPTCKISKSKFMAGLQCAKRGYLQVRHPGDNRVHANGNKVYPVQMNGRTVYVTIPED